MSYIQAYALQKPQLQAVSSKAPNLKLGFGHGVPWAIKFQMIQMESSSYGKRIGMERKLREGALTAFSGVAPGSLGKHSVIPFGVPRQHPLVSQSSDFPNPNIKYTGFKWLSIALST